VGEARSPEAETHQLHERAPWLVKM